MADPMREARKHGTDSPHEPTDEFVVHAFAEGARELWPDSRDPGWHVTFRRWLERHDEAVRAEDAARLAEVERLVTEYESAITWDTTCLNCSSLMHKNIAEYVRAEKAEERLAAVQEIADRGITGWDLTPTVSGKEDVTWWYDYLRALDNIWRTRVTAALGVTAPTASEAKGCGWCGHGAGHTTDEHGSRWGIPGDAPGAPAPAEASEVEGSDRG